ncbi:MAG: peptidylprolyl isomerase [Candidatus Poribacteria bacterium]|nr:peptidylprolyl isomerase [Candidatus Poribacteria bacterium]
MNPKSFILALVMLIVVFSIILPCDARIFDRIIAYVNDDVITKRRLDVLVKQRAFELQQVEGYSEREALIEAEKERGDLLDRLIRQMLLLEAALTLKVQVTDVEIEEQINKLKGQYQIPSDEEFEKLLNRDGLTLIAFREQLQRNLMTEKLVMGRILPRLQVRDSDVQKFYEENRDKLPTKADRISLRQIFIAFKPSESNKKQTYDTAKTTLEEIRLDKTQFENIAKRIAAKYKTSAQAGVLIETTPAEILTFPNVYLTALAKLKDGEISELIEGDDGFHVFMVETRSDDKIMFRHVTVPYIFSDEEMQAAQESAEEIVKKLEAGEEFTELAKTYSDDSETKEKGGDIGILTITTLNPEIREIVESLEVGKFSKPFETETGIYIFKVEDRIVPELTGQEKLQIIGILRQQLFEKEWTAYTDSLMENAYIKIKPEAVPTQISKDN